jgi:hypothetical protein
LPRLDLPLDHVNTAAAVWAAAAAVQRRRVAAYVRLPAQPEAPQRAEPEPPPAPIVLPAVPWEAIRDEVARQANVECWMLSKSGGRKLRTVALRQLAVALTRRLTRLSLPVIARKFQLRDHTTVLWAVTRMRPLIAVLELELTDEDTVADWVRGALPLLAAHVAEIRAKYREHGKPMSALRPRQKIAATKRPP